MYYILNETKQLIAADENLLNLCGVSHINELSSKIAKGDTQFDLMSNEAINMIAGEKAGTYSISTTSLSSMLGNLTLVAVTITSDDTQEISYNSLLEEEISITPEKADDSTELLDDIQKEDTPVEDLETYHDQTSPFEIEEKDDEITFGDHLDIDDNVMSLKELSSDTTEEEDKQQIDSAELFDLIPEEDKNQDIAYDDNISSIIDDEVVTFDLKENDLTSDTEELSEINIDIDEISRIIGISPDEYNGFLNEFIDTALELEQDLQNTVQETRDDATNTLIHLSEILRLPVMEEILTKIANTSNSDVQRKDIESFYGSLSRITTNSSPEEKTTVTVEENLELFEDLETLKEPPAQKEVKLGKTKNEKSFGTISLKNIRPKYFDFQLEEAANDLSLPVELIEEFVHDFIDQAHIETKKMLEAYEDGDLDAIQKIGHLLKGASSNLRINALSDTLYKIQFCEDSTNLDQLIQDYWAHFLSFENQINMISK